jgi:hypothetical protein
MTEVAESLTAQLDSQSKLAMLRRENRKIRNENEIWKANEQLRKGQELKIYRKIPKNMYENLVTLSLGIRITETFWSRCDPYKNVTVLYSIFRSTLLKKQKMNASISVLSNKKYNF